MLEAIVLLTLTFALALSIGIGIGYYIGSKPKKQDPEPVIVSNYWTDEAKDDC